MKSFMTVSIPLKSFDYDSMFLQSLVHIYVPYCIVAVELDSLNVLT